MPWSPVLSGPEKNRAKEIVFQIAEELLNSTFKNISLINGASGVLLFYYYLFLYTNDNKYKKISREIVEKIVHEVPNLSKHNLSAGYTGVVWTLNFLKKRGFLPELPNDFFDEIEEDIIIRGISDLKNNFYDYLHGGLGCCLYFTDTFPSKLAERSLSLIIDYLSKTCVLESDQAKWSNDFFPSTQEEDSNIKEFNLGLAHGIPSIALLLSKIYATGIRTSDSKHLTLCSVNWILRQRTRNEQFAFFPYYIKKNSLVNLPSQLAWCYGDLGVTIALYQIANNIQSQSLKDQAISFMTEAISRSSPEYSNRIVDAGLCHGTTSIAHICSRFFNYTGDKTFKKYSEFWYKETFTHQKYLDGLAGFKTCYAGEFVNREGLLEGVSGIGLSFLSAISTIEPEWDKCLLLA